MHVYTVNPRKLEQGFRRIGARIPYAFPEGMKILMFQLSGFYYNQLHKINKYTCKNWEVETSQSIYLYIYIINIYIYMQKCIYTYIYMY